MDQFSYYMIRIRHSPTESRSKPLFLAGVVERLGAGEKRNFADGTELIRLLSGWTEGPPNMGTGPQGDKV